MTVTAVAEDTEGEGATVAIFTVTDLPERPYFLEASYLKNLTLEHDAITGMVVGVKCLRIKIYNIISAFMLQTVSWSAQWLL